MERGYSDPGPDSELKMPEVPPLLPQIPTATFLADRAREDRMDAELARAKQTEAMMRSLLGKNGKNGAASAPPTRK